MDMAMAMEKVKRKSGLEEYRKVFSNKFYIVKNYIGSQKLKHF